MKRCYHFLGREVSGTEDRVTVIPVPVEYSTSYVKGTAKAPEAIFKASMQIELFNSSLNFDLAESGIVTLRPEIKNKKDLYRFLKSHKNELKDTFPVFLGGEHSITPWILDMMGYDNIGIVWLDAHADLRSEYEGNTESHACAARNSLRFGPIVEIGIRSMCSEEKKYISNAKRVKVFRKWNRKAMEAIGKLPKNIYLSLDFDVFDPSLVRAVGTPEPGGLIWDDVMSILSFLFREKRVVGMDAVELCPNKVDEASNFIAAKTVYEAVSRRLIKGK